MKILRHSLLFVSFLALSGISFGQLKPIASGDIITIETSNAKQAGNDPIVFVPASSGTFSVLLDGEITKLLGTNGRVRLVRDKFLTVTAMEGREVAPEYRMVLFPPDGELRPGMQWALPPQKIETACFPMMANFTATAESGPDLSIAISGKETAIRTMRIKYEATLPACDGRRTWRRTHEVIYSPELKLIVRQNSIDWSAAGPLQYLSDGGGKQWTTKAIQTPGVLKNADVQTAK